MKSTHQIAHRHISQSFVLDQEVHDRAIGACADHALDEDERAKDHEHPVVVRVRWDCCCRRWRYRQRLVHGRVRR